MLTIDNGLFKYKNPELSYLRDGRRVRTTTLKGITYTSGATRHDLRLTLVTKTPEQLQYFNGVIKPAWYIDDEFKFILTSEYQMASDSITPYKVKTEVTAGSNTIIIDTAPNGGGTITGTDFVPGNYINITGSDRLYTINSFDQITDALVLEPRIDKDIPADSTINISTPSIIMNCVNQKLVMSTAEGTKNYRTIELMFEENV